MINDLIGNAIGSKSDAKNNKNSNAKAGAQAGNLTRGTTSPAQTAPAARGGGESKAGELSMDNVTVLADKRINGLVVMARREDMPTLHQIIESMDVKLSQVLIETVIIEVTLGDGLDVGVDWISRGRNSSRKQANLDAFGNERRYVKNSDGVIVGAASENEFAAMDDGEYTLTDSIAALPTLVRDGLENIVGESAWALRGGGFGGKTAISAMSDITTNFLSKGVNAIVKMDKLNLGAIIQASKTDSRTKYLASPVIMTVDNKEASVEATEMRYLFKGYAVTSSYNGTAEKDYEQKDVGTRIKVTPKINPNGTVMLTIETEYSIINRGAQEVDGVLQDTTTTRKMTADVLMENMQTVVLGGLTENSKSESETGVPFLKDIPWIGKWLFSHTEISDARKELLIFMTPYVLDDAEMAEAEALRRKRSLSDTTPWDDNGWSASKLADPVEKRELMRRLKEEAKKQDEERQTKLAIEQWKLERAKKLEQMDAQERAFWIEQHKKELQKEEREEFEKWEKEQEDLKGFAASIRSNRLEKAETKLKDATDAYRAGEGGK
jgi:general secretion pathway protein D